jgi:hypothetical protein
VAQNFLLCDRDQPLLLPPDVRDWLDEDHLAWFVIEAIDELETLALYPPGDRGPSDDCVTRPRR